MGFLSDMRSINKIYNKLKSIESDMINIEKCNQGILNFRMLAPAFSRITKNLEELSEIVSKSSPTVLNADFQFCGLKRPIRVHIFNITQWVLSFSAKSI